MPKNQITQQRSGKLISGNKKNRAQRDELMEDEGSQLGHAGRNSQRPMHLDDDDDVQINSKNESEYDDEEDDDMVSVGCQNIKKKTHELD